MHSSDATLKAGALLFFEKDDNSNGIAMIPIKLSYRYLTTGKEEGFYVEQHAG